MLVSTAPSYFNGKIYQAFSRELLTFMEWIFSESAVSYEAVKKNLRFWSTVALYIDNNNYLAVL